MYKMLGADGKEYGPVSAAQLRDWITEGRANAQTQVLPEGAPEWKQIGELSEFFVALGIAATKQSAASAAASPSTPKTNSMAVAALILGIIAATCGLCCYGFPFNILGIIFSLIALSQIKNSQGTQQGRGMAIAGLILSILSIIIGALFFTLGVAMNSSDILRKIENL